MAEIMKLLFVIGELAPGGAENHLLRIAPRLAEQGLDVSVFTLSRRGVLADRMEQLGVSVINAPTNNWRIFRHREFGLVKLLFSSLYLSVLLIRMRPQVVHYFLPMAYLVGGIVSVALRIKMRVMSRRSLNLYQKNYSIIRSLETWLHPKMDAILVNSKAIVDDLEGEGVP